YPAWRDAILAASPAIDPPRRYPGHVTHRLPRPLRRLWPPLDHALARRRRLDTLGTELPAPRALGRPLHLSHGLTAPHGRGPLGGRPGGAGAVPGRPVAGLVARGAVPLRPLRPLPVAAGADRPRRAGAAGPVVRAGARRVDRVGHRRRRRPRAAEVRRARP